MKKILGRIQIKPDWDEKVSWYKDPPNIASPLELDAYKQVIDFLIRKESGSLIVSGDRGAGKTTTLINAVRFCEKDVVFPVYLNSAHLESFADCGLEDTLGMLKILKLLVRSLLRELESKKKKVPFELNQLLHDCEATRMSISHSLSIDTKLSIGTKLSSIWNLATQLFPWLDFGVKLESSVDSSFSHIDSTNSVWEKTGLSIEDFVDRFSKIIKILEKKGVFTSESPKLYSLQLRLLRKVIKVELSDPWKKKYTKKLVFILDELDVYDGDGESKIKSKEVLSALKKFKNLFTLSTAHFIFIVGKKTYLEAKVDPYRTLFSDRCYLSTPDGSKLSEFIERVVIGRINKDLRQEWEEIKWYFIMCSKHNLYDLISIVNSYSDYDQKDKQLFVKIFERTTSEKTLTSLHYLLNSVFVYHKQSPIFENNNDDLFEELISLENNFKKYLLQGLQEPFSLDVGRDSGNIEVNSGLKDAKIALVKSLFLFSNKQAPKITTEPTIVLPWDELIQFLSFDKVKAGVFGAVTTIEQALINETNELVKSINLRFGNYLDTLANNSNFGKTLVKLSSLLGVEFNQDDINSVLQSLDQIYHDPIDKRNWEQITQSSQSLKAISSILLKYVQYGSDFIARADWGQAEVDNSIVKLGADASHGNSLISRFTILLPIIDKEDFSIRANVKLSSGALVNILLYRDYAQTEIESDFYMARLDGRQPESSFGDCILHKPKAASWDIVPDSTIRKTSSEVDKTVEIMISLHRNILELKKRKKMKYELISRTKTDGRVNLIGISNELASAEVKMLDLKIGTKVYH